MPLMAFLAVTLLTAPIVSAQCFIQGGNTVSLGGPYVVADFNGDGKIDVAGPNTSLAANSVAVSLGNGDGTLQPALTFGVGSFPARFVAVGDFNGDGKLDFATANTQQFQHGNVSILLGNGDGTFGTPVSYVAGNEPISIAVGDFNADGTLDLAVANRGESSVLDPGSLSILLGIGDGRFRPAVNYAVGNSPQGVVVGDFNRDGKLDLAVANRLSRNTSILLGNGDGTFPAAVSYGPGHSNISIAVSDFNGDGIQDLAVSNDDPLPGGIGGHYISILIGSGDGSFPTTVDFPVTVSPYGGGSSFAIGDYNGDGRPDISVGNVTRPLLSILLGNGDGTFQAGLLYSTSQGGPLTAADLNGDGKVDLLVTFAEVNVWLNGCAGPHADISITLDNNEATAIVGSTVT